MKIEIGCGKRKRKGYVTCDIRDLPEVDYVCSADALPFEGGTVHEIYSRHVIEHFTLKEFLTILVEWNRVLIPGGKLYIICPKLTWHLKQIIDENGWQQDEYDVHKFGNYFQLLSDILLDFGFDGIIDLANHPNSLEKAPWHLEVSATKKQTLFPVKNVFSKHILM